jgi:hypothetical protein
MQLHCCQQQVGSHHGASFSDGEAPVPPLLLGLPFRWGSTGTTTTVGSPFQMVKHRYHHYCWVSSRSVPFRWGSTGTTTTVGSHHGASFSDGEAPVPPLLLGLITERPFQMVKHRYHHYCWVSLSDGEAPVPPLLYLNSTLLNVHFLPPFSTFSGTGLHCCRWPFSAISNW